MLTELHISLINTYHKSAMAPESDDFILAHAVPLISMIKPPQIEESIDTTKHPQANTESFLEKRIVNFE